MQPSDQAVGPETPEPEPPKKKGAQPPATEKTKGLLKTALPPQREPPTRDSKTRRMAKFATVSDATSST
ncbi:MAG: hypothetical protein FWD36_02120 [Treponema sp.]|nr:hypothetical protein [Treponema sp.]